MLEGTPSLRSLAAIAALAAAVRLFAAWAIPFSAGSGDPNFAPDEAQHFKVIRDLSAGRASVWPESLSVYSGRARPLANSQGIRSIVQLEPAP